LFGDALVALKEVTLASADNELTWMNAAARLRRAAVECRRRAPRHAALALIMSDALTFTTVGHDRPHTKTALITALQTLQEPFVSSQREREILDSLLRSGWSLTGPFDADTFADIAPDLLGRSPDQGTEG
jgi:hypothetical protein